MLKTSELVRISLYWINQQIDANNIPFNERFEVHASPVHGYGCSHVMVTIHSGEHVAYYGGELIDLDEFWEAIPDPTGCSLCRRCWWSVLS